MRVEWTSQQGSQTRTNNDAAAVGRKGNCLLAMLVGGAERGEGQALARHWAISIITDALAADEPPEASALVRLMQARQRELRQHYLHEIASYCCVRLDLNSRRLDVLHVGDCLAGVCQPDGQIDWLMIPHTLSRQPFYHSTPQASDPASRHLLTRSLNARRFCAPEHRVTMLATGTELLLCTDGYWYEHRQQGVALSRVHDDASELRLSPGAMRVIQAPDSDNLFIIAD